MEAGLGVIVSMGLGLWADSHFGTSPLWLFVGLGVGVGSFALRITQVVRKTSGIAQHDRQPPPEQTSERDGPTE
ncbi:MAG: AtpZ/AtpI family protein [Myxococcota bacterium]|nr:hypothetical protein [Deltaproteobacteria bacterium]MDP7074110.1 AtpZ/AtpI family protein [Myxococcota bacterium]MDP7431977.1 AtpZ/AtpI family protein [Myxococcota bacterium]MDP7572282.1 AtpZ/AtpI family protein [Myxococcota bacterium]